MIIENAIQEINNRYAEKITALTLDGKIHRSGDKDHVWYVGHTWEYKGNSYSQINYGSWRQGDQHTINSWDSSLNKDRNFIKNYKKHVQESNAKLEMEKQRKHKDCREKWKPIFARSTGGKLHSYLDYKGINDPYISRVDQNDVLLIPVYNSSGLVGVQRIFKNELTGKFEKRFSSGIEIEYGFCPLTKVSSEVIYVSEGFATAASIQMAFPTNQSVCVFNAGNIPKAIKELRKIKPDCRIVICADRDKNGVGEKYARQAQKQNANIVIRVPQFGIKNDAWSDFNDLHQFEGIDKVREQLAIDRLDFTELHCLGYMESEYYYSSSDNNQIIRISASGHSNVLNMLQLIPVEWWKKTYGIKDEESDNVIVPWKEVASKLMDQCRQAGLFNPEKVRGIGVWEDGSHFIVNNGQEILPKVNPISQYHYQKLVKSEHALSRELDQEELDYLLTGFMNIHYKNKKDYLYLSAWIIQAQIFSVLPWRFHLWLTGQRGNGKSEIVKWCSQLVPNSLLTMNATAAGIRQELKNNARAICFDESEPDSGRIDGIMELARQMSTNSEAKVLRGSAHGDAIRTNTQCLFLMGSIQTVNFNSADASRFFVVEITPPKDQTAEQFDELSTVFSLISKDKANLFTTAFNAIPSILSSINICKRHFRDHYRMESRLADQLSAAVACFWVYSSRKAITTAQLDDIVEAYGLIQSDYMESNQSQDSESCYHDIMNCNPDIRENKTLARIIEQVMVNQSKPDYGDGNSCQFTALLSSLGIRVLDKKKLFLASNSAKLKKIVPKWSDYARILTRDKEYCIEPRKNCQIKGYNAGSVTKGIIIKMPE